HARRADAPLPLHGGRGLLHARRARRHGRCAGRHGQGRGRPGRSSSDAGHDGRAGPAERSRVGAGRIRLRRGWCAGSGRSEVVSTRTVEYMVTRTPELGEDGRPVRVPVLPPGMEPELEGEHMLINIGPQHPATHGVLRLVLELDGETVIKCTPHIGYLHSSFEKLGEYRTWNQIVPLTDRMDYLAPLIYNCAYAMAVEKLMGIEVTERCKVLRVILMELDRIFSHLLWLGTTAIDLGAFTVFLYTFQERERIYN